MKTTNSMESGTQICTTKQRAERTEHSRQMLGSLCSQVRVSESGHDDRSQLDDGE